MLATLTTVLSNWKYAAFAAAVSVLVFTVVIWLPNAELILLVVFDSAGSFTNKTQFLLSLYGSIGTNFTPISATYSLIIALLFGVNVALLAYYIKRMRGGFRSLGNSSVFGIGGFVSGLFGIGCAACGSFVLASVLGLVGATSILLFLPFGGAEFGLFGIVLLIFSTNLISKRITDPLICKTE